MQKSGIEESPGISRIALARFKNKDLPVCSVLRLIVAASVMSPSFVLPAKDVIVDRGRTAVLVAGHEEGWDADEHVVGEDAEAPEVGRLTVRLALKDLRGHVDLR